MPTAFLTLGLLAILGPIWALVFGRLAIRQKDVLERILWAALGLLGLAVAAPAWFLQAG